MRPLYVVVMTSAEKFVDVFTQEEGKRQRYGGMRNGIIDQAHWENMVKQMPHERLRVECCIMAAGAVYHLWVVEK